MAEETKSTISVAEMEKAGVGFGHRVSKLHPKMNLYVSGVKNNVNIFDLEKTAKELERALKFIAKLAKEGKIIIFVGTKPQLRDLIKSAAQDCKMPYVSERWLGGTFTNFLTLQKRVDYFKDLERKKSEGELGKYTKKERLNFDREIESLRIKFEGVKNMEKLPEAVFIVGIDKNMAVIQEAKRMGIKIIGVIDTNINPEVADYPIPANDDAISSVTYILEKIKATIINK